MTLLKKIFKFTMAPVMAASFFLSPTYASNHLESDLKPIIPRVQLPANADAGDTYTVKTSKGSLIYKKTSVPLEWLLTQSNKSNVKIILQFYTDGLFKSMSNQGGLGIGFAYRDLRNSTRIMGNKFLIIKTSS